MREVHGERHIDHDEWFGWVQALHSCDRRQGKLDELRRRPGGAALIDGVPYRLMPRLAARHHIDFTNLFGNAPLSKGGDDGYTHRNRGGAPDRSR